jgi:hypothetical protein
LGDEALAPDKHTLVFDFGFDGKVISTKTIPKTMKFTFPEDETFDVASDTRTPIDDRDYQVPFRFTGKLD